MMIINHGNVLIFNMRDKRKTILFQIERNRLLVSLIITYFSISLCTEILYWRVNMNLLPYIMDLINILILIAIYVLLIIRVIILITKKDSSLKNKVVQLLIIIAVMLLIIKSPVFIMFVSTHYIQI